MKSINGMMFAAVAGIVAISAPVPAMAQQDRNTNSITLDLKDAPIRTTLEMAFKQAGITNYVIDNNVAGFVTMTITEQPFENALKLIMRAATIPLTYIKENNVYIVKPRQITQPSTAPAPDISREETNEQDNVTFERIPLTFIDPLDLQMAFGNVLYIRQFIGRMGAGGGMGMGGMGGGMGGMGGGMGGMGGGMGMGGMGGGMGGMGGGMGMGGMGGGMGGMGGGMGGMGGGMGGMGGGMGMGGFGGGRNF